MAKIAEDDAGVNNDLEEEAEGDDGGHNPQNNNRSEDAGADRVLPDTRELRARGRNVNDQIQQVDFQGEMVYATPVQNVIAAHFSLRHTEPPASAEPPGDGRHHPKGEHYVVRCHHPCKQRTQSSNHYQSKQVHLRGLEPEGARPMARARTLGAQPKARSKSPGAAPKTPVESCCVQHI